jgi:hypothetical protein
VVSQTIRESLTIQDLVNLIIPVLVSLAIRRLENPMALESLTVESLTILNLENQMAPVSQLDQASLISLLLRPAIHGHPSILQQKLTSIYLGANHTHDWPQVWDHWAGGLMTYVLG